MISFKSLRRRYFESEYKSGFLYILSSKMLIAAATFVTTPFIARLYSPADYGLFALMNSIAITISLFSNLTLPVSVVVLDESRILSTITGVIGYCILTNLLFLASGLVLASLDLRWFGSVLQTSTLVCLVIFSSFLISITQLLANLNIREKAFKKNVAVNLMDSLSVRTLSVTLGFMNFTKFGLLYSDLLGKCINILTQLYFKNFRLPILGRELFKWNNIKTTIVLNDQYPKYNLPASLINNFSTQIVLWLLAFYFSKQSVGYFTMSLGLLNIPLILLSSSFQPLVTKKLHDESDVFYRHFLGGLLLKILTISSITYLFIYFLSPFFIAIYLGDKWLNCVTIVQVMCVPFALQLLGNSLSGAFIVLNKQKVNLIVKAVFLAILLVVLYYQNARQADLTRMVVLYSIIVSGEEFVKILYLILLSRNVRSSSVL